MGGLTHCQMWSQLWQMEPQLCQPEVQQQEQQEQMCWLWGQLQLLEPQPVRRWWAGSESRRHPACPDSHSPAAVT